MALDPEDPLIPLPWQMKNIRAYRAQRALEAEKANIDYQKAMMDYREKLRETPEGRITEAEELARRAEQVKQQREGIPMGEVAREAALRGGMNLLEASKAQGEYDVNQRVLATRQAAIENILAGGKGLIPTASVNVGGITQTVPASMAALTSAQIQENVYNATWPRVAAGYVSRGYDRQTAESLAKKETMQNAFQTEKNGKITILSVDGYTTKTYSDAEAKATLQDPDTPEKIKEQLRVFLGPEKKSTASSWINTRLGR